MNSPTSVVTETDCPATLVPSGVPTVLAAGESVVVVQRLGASATVRTADGALLRIARENLGSLGFDTGAQPGAPEAAEGPFDMAHVTAALDSVYDPEIPVSIVELGLVYRCEEVMGEAGRRIEIDLSMTAPGCGMGDVLRDDVVRATLSVPGVDEADVSLVFEPPWSMDRMTEAARLELGLL